MITPREIAVALRRPAPTSGDAEWLQWGMWIEDALMLIEARLGPVGELNLMHLDYVVREAVVAQVRRPDDATSVSVSVDDGSVQKSYRSSRGRVVILDEWWALLSPATDDGGAFTVNLGVDPTLNHAPWCAIVFGALYCSCGADLTLSDPLYEV